MIVEYTKQEKAKIRALEAKYKRLYEECEAEIARLRSDELDPDGSKEAAIHAKRLPEPIELRPSPIEYTSDGEPVYDSKELAAYRSTPEYRAYMAANEAANEELSAMYDAWESRPSASRTSSGLSRRPTPRAR